MESEDAFGGIQVVEFKKGLSSGVMYRLGHSDDITRKKWQLSRYETMEDAIRSAKFDGMLTHEDTLRKKDLQRQARETVESLGFGEEEKNLRIEHHEIERKMINGKLDSISKTDLERYWSIEKRQREILDKKEDIRKSIEKEFYR